MKNSTIIGAFLFIFMISSGCGTDEKGSVKDTLLESSAESLDALSDKDFVMKVSEANMAEIQMGQLAASKSTDQDVKAFGQKMAREHLKAQEELKKIAQTKKIKLSDSLTADHMEAKEKLSSMTGMNFDKAYIQSQVMDHQKALILFQNEAKEGKDKEVKAYAEKFMPHIQMHLNEVKTLQEATSRK